MTVDTNLELPVPWAREHAAAERAGLPAALTGGVAGLIGGGVLTTGVVLAVQGHGTAGVAVIIAVSLVIAVASVISAGLAIVTPRGDRENRETP